MSYSGDRDSVEITITDSNVIVGTDSLDKLLDDLGFSSAVSERMGRTRALDGTQRASSDKANATWTYHPDDGLQ